jgi:hypothetical protein
MAGNRVLSAGLESIDPKSAYEKLAAQELFEK